MIDRSRKYSELEIQALAEALKEDEKAYSWLKYNNCKELAALSDVILHASESAKDWLFDYNFQAISAFLSALADSRSAFEYLMDSDHKEWAAVCSALQDDSEAIQWLVKHDLNYYGYLARILYEIMESEMPNSYFSALAAARGGSGGGGGSYSGGGFSGGGGSFGGGGASGGW